MIRSFHLITASPFFSEHVVLTDGQVAVRSRICGLSRPDEGEVPGTDSLDGVLEGKFSDEPAVIVVPTGWVRFRQVEFPFSDPGKIKLALPFELENEVLEDLSSLVYYHQIRSEPDSRSMVSVYLMEKAHLTQVLARTQAGGLFPVRVVFSAQALLSAYPTQSPLHIQVYAGMEETYVSIVRRGVVVTAKSYPPLLQTLIGSGPACGIKSPDELLDYLSREGEAWKNPVDGGLTLTGEIARLAGDLTRFIQNQSLGEPFTLTLHGLFAPSLVWRGDLPAMESQGFRMSRDVASSDLMALPVDVDPTEPGPGKTKTTPPQKVEGKKSSVGLTVHDGLEDREMCGLGQDLILHPERLIQTRGVGFYEKRVGIFASLKGVRTPLLSAGLFALVLVALGVVNGVLSLGGMARESRRLDGEIRTVLSRQAGAGTDVANAIRVLDQQVAQLRQTRRADGVLAGGNAVMDLLTAVSGVAVQGGSVKVDEVVYENNSLMVSGRAAAKESAEGFYTRLKSNSAFSGWQAEFTTRKTDQGEVFQVSFRR